MSGRRLPTGVRARGGLPGIRFDPEFGALSCPTGALAR